MSSEVTISVNNISKRYEMYAQPRDRLLQFFSFGKRQYFKEFWALRNMSFTIKKGETVGILGRNGSGKSTLLQIIAGTLTPTTGEVRTHGVLAALLELGSGFNPEFSGRENIFLNGAILGFSKEEMEQRLKEIISFADIGEHLDQPVKTYSSGMAVRLAFAVQACVSPEILIVDEALAVGDEKFQRKCFDYIERLRENGCSILLVTHSTATIEKFCQRGILVHKGEIHGIGPAKEIVDQYHALMYSDEKAYLRYKNTVLANEETQKSEPIQDDSNLVNTDQSEKPCVEEDVSSHARGLIQEWEILDVNQQPSELFKTGDSIRLSYTVKVFQPIQEIQAGILIRTIEGVRVYGTSTLYHENNYIDAKPGNVLKFDFELKANLCEGSYFITLAIAEAISHGDMLYLDRKTDVIVFQVYQPRIMATGIAMLDARVNTGKIETL